MLENFEFASAEWQELLNYLEPELCRELPVVFILTLHARQPLDQLPSEDLTRAQQWALQMASADKAEIYFLSRVTEEDISNYLAPAVPELVKKLSALTDGIPMPLKACG